MRHKYGSALMRRRARSGLLFISPWVVGAIAFFLIPLVKTVIYSFGEVEFDANGYYYAFSGADKYHTMFFENADYLPMLWGSVKDLLLTVPVVLVFSFFVALLLKQKFHGNAVMKAIFFLPVIMSSGAFLTMQSGLSQINSAVDSSMAEVTQTVSVLSSVNLEKYLLEMGLSEKLIGYITAPIDNIYSVITVSGIQIFIFLAGLNAISPSLYEACFIEGGGKWETFWKITFPMMMPMVLVNVVYSIVNTFTSDANEVMQYTSRLAFTNFRFGLSSAMSLMYLLIVSAILGLVSWLISRRIFYYT